MVIAELPSHLLMISGSSELIMILFLHEVRHDTVRLERTAIIEGFVHIGDTFGRSDEFNVADLEA